MPGDLFDIGADVDADALLARIRESARRRSGTVCSEAEHPAVQVGPGTNERLMNEIGRGGLFIESINRIPLRFHGSKGKLELRIKRLLKWLVHWNTKAQADFNHSTIISLGLIAQELLNTERSVAAIMQVQHEQREQYVEARRELDEAISRIASMSAELARITEEARCLASDTARELDYELNEIKKCLATMEATSDGAAQRVSQMLAHQAKTDHALDEVRVRVIRAERQLKSIPREPGPQTEENKGKWNERPSIDAEGRLIDHPRRTNAHRTEEDDRLPNHAFDYFLFEHFFRGSVADVKNRQSIYVQSFMGRDNVVDLGCGRGEFVELLSESGIDVTGVDNNQDMVDFCRDRSLRVLLADIFEYLSTVPDGSLGGIFTSQVVEHLTAKSVIDLVNQCGRKLKQGGLIVAETVNTNCLAALSNFYLDPTHVRPVPAQMLRFIFEQGPFQIDRLKFTSPIEGHDVSKVLDVIAEPPQEMALYRDYAVIAVRR